MPGISALKQGIDVDSGDKRLHIFQNHAIGKI
jgi:hypothetical protein